MSMSQDAYGGAMPTNVFMDKTKVTTPPKLRYILGRSNHCDGTEDVYGGKYGTSGFHVNPYFSYVTAIQMSNRRQWIVEIQSDPTSSDSPTTQRATLPTITPATCGRASLPDAPEID